jgi:hypothetical protein
VYSDGKNEQVSEASSAHPFVEAEIVEEEKGFLGFVSLGMAHIGVAASEWMGPGGFHVAEGFDHFVFIFALMLDWGSALALLRTITGFTLGHTLSVTLAEFGIVRVPTHWVECLIAATIAGTAALALRGQLRPQARGPGSTLSRRYWIPTLIGAIHGLGFASAIRGLQLSPGGIAKAVLGFNCGVELAQLVVIAIAYPLLRQIRKRSWGERYAFPLLTSMLLLVAAFWSVQRGVGA